MPARNYDVFEDGGFIASLEQFNDDEKESSNLRERHRELQVVLNFFEVLRQRVGD